MSTDPTLRPLSLVPQTARDGAGDWRAEIALRQSDPETQLVGALMHLRPPRPR